MTVFADSSAVVKLYADEADHERIRSIEGPLVVSALARVEVAAALWRKQRMGELAVEDAVILIDAFEADWNAAYATTPSFAPVAVLPEVLRRAGRLLAHHPLRAYDAVQLASAMAARDAIDEPLEFAAFDHALLDAAAREGFVLLS